MNKVSSAVVHGPRLIRYISCFKPRTDVGWHDKGAAAEARQFNSTWHGTENSGAFKEMCIEEEQQYSYLPTMYYEGRA